MADARYDDRDCHVIIHAGIDCGDQISSVLPSPNLSVRQKRRYVAAAKKLIKDWKDSGTPIIAFHRLLAADEEDKDLKIIRRYKLTCRGFIKGNYHPQYCSFN